MMVASFPKVAIIIIMSLMIHGGFLFAEIADVIARQMLVGVARRRNTPAHIQWVTQPGSKPGNFIGIRTR